MKIKCFILIGLLFLLSSLYSENKSTAKALLLSAAIPGAGEFYLGNNKLGGIFLGAELMIVLSHFRLNNEINWKKNSYMLYANRYADIPLNSTDNYYRFISNYVSSDDYNKDIELFYRNRFLIYEYNPEQYELYTNRYMVSEEDSWHWQSENSLQEYRRIRRDKQQMEILSNFAIGASILNRLLSVIDVALISRKNNHNYGYSSELSSSFLSGISFEPDLIRNGLSIKYEHQF